MMPSRQIDSHGQQQQCLRAFERRRREIHRRNTKHKTQNSNRKNEATKEKQNNNQCKITARAKHINTYNLCNINIFLLHGTVCARVYACVCVRLLQRNREQKKSPPSTKYLRFQQKCMEKIFHIKI